MSRCRELGRNGHCGELRNHGFIRAVGVYYGLESADRDYFGPPELATEPVALRRYLRPSVLNSEHPHDALAR